MKIHHDIARSQFRCSRKEEKRVMYHFRKIPNPNHDLNMIVRPTTTLTEIVFSYQNDFNNLDSTIYFYFYVDFIILYSVYFCGQHIGVSLFFRYLSEIRSRLSRYNKLCRILVLALYVTPFTALFLFAMLK